jgi:hypothetical protein
MMMIFLLYKNKSKTGFELFHNPQDVNADGRPKQVTQAEAVLNWQSQNAIAQNYVLHRIESKVDLV